MVKDEVFGNGSAGNESACNAEDLGLIPGEGKGYPLQYSIVHGVAKSRTQLNDFHFHF